LHIRACVLRPVADSGLCNGLQHFPAFFAAANWL
jgi:DNA-directed RNA polymerase